MTENTKPTDDQTEESTPEDKLTDDSTQVDAADTELDELKKALTDAEKSADILKDQLLRKAAEFENFRRRTETETMSIIRNANERLITGLLPTLNDFVRSLKAGKEKRDFDSFFKGIELIYNKFSKVLEAQGLTPIESVGKPFDVDYHDALMQVSRDDVPPGTVIEEVERGYKLNEKILTHSKVIVSTGTNQSPGKTETAARQGGNEGNE